MSKLKKSTFITGPKDALDVVDIYDAEALKSAVANKLPIDVNKINTSVTKYLSSEGIKAALNDSAFMKDPTLLKLGLDGAISDIISNMPNDLSPLKLFDKYSVPDLYSNLNRLKKGIGISGWNNLTMPDLEFLLDKTQKFTDSLLSGVKEYGNELRNKLIDNFGRDVVVSLSTSLHVINKAFSKYHNKNIWELLKEVDVPKVLRQKVLEELADIASKNGNGLIASGILTLMGDNGAKSKIQRSTIIELMKNFKYVRPGPQSQLNLGSRKLVQSISQLVGVDISVTDRIIDLVAPGFDLDSYSYKTQSKLFVDALYAVDSRWDKGIPSPYPTSNLEYYAYASDDAKEALLQDERTLVTATVAFHYGTLNHFWTYTASLWYGITIPTSK